MDPWEEPVERKDSCRQSAVSGRKKKANHDRAKERSDTIKELKRLPNNNLHSSPKVFSPSLPVFSPGLHTWKKHHCLDPDHSSDPGTTRKTHYQPGWSLWMTSKSNPLKKKPPLPRKIFINYHLHLKFHQEINQQIYKNLFAQVIKKQ